MTTNYLSKKEKLVSDQFEKNGFVVFDIKQKKLIKEIDKIISNYIKKKIKIKKISRANYVLNNFHKLLENKNLNKVRLDILKRINNSKLIKKLYYEASRDLLNIIVGNELVMQKKINLSIQLPKDDSSLLDVHSDIWSGDSPYEVVVWIPLVNCFKTKSMYILKANKYKKFEKKFKYLSKKNSSFILKNIKKDINWIKINRGQALIFNQALPHGNIVNTEKETRWSLNCRFKSLFSPYGDKKIAEFFQPITVRKMSELGMNYKFPGIK
tara:strand:+ start:729 stop:1532 length:804 start_codon:yes stop_codon:yes gene_type:complete